MNKLDRSYIYKKVSYTTSNNLVQKDQLSTAAFQDFRSRLSLTSEIVELNKPWIEPGALYMQSHFSITLQSPYVPRSLKKQPEFN